MQKVALRHRMDSNLGGSPHISLTCVPTSIKNAKNHGSDEVASREGNVS
jgi:hypothetical protein